MKIVRLERQGGFAWGAVSGDGIVDLSRMVGGGHGAIHAFLDDDGRKRLADHVAGRTADMPPLLILSGGELTVTRTGDGVGGPNAEYALALALALDGAPGIRAIACDTDGVDGAAEIAGAQVGPDTLTRAMFARRDPAQALAQNDAHSFFAALGDQVVTGPTLTNVNDFRAILIRPA